MKFFLKILFLSIFLSSCSFFKSTLEEQKIVTITTNPIGAEIFSSKDEKIGETPLTLTETQVKQLQNGEQFNFIVRKAGYIDREIVYSFQAITDIKLTLSRISREKFNETIIHAYNLELNQLTRELLQIHGLLFLSKYQEASDKIVAFQKKFPGVAASYTLMGNIYLTQKKTKEAKEQFLRAVSIDPNDETANRSLENLE
jgi:tetratricopeptide (TPR) repeat protein